MLNVIFETMRAEAKSLNWLKYVVLTGIFIVPFLPLFVSTSMFFPFITGKNFAFRIIVEIILAAWLILALADRSFHPRRSILMYAVGALVAVTGLATILGVDPYRSFWSNFERMDGYITLLHLGAYFLVLISVMKSWPVWRRLFYTTLFANFLILIWGFVQLAGGATIHQGGVRLDASLGNAAYLATYGVFHIFFALYLLWKEKEKSLKWFLGGLVFLNLIILFYTATRGAILGLIGGVFLLGLISAFLYWKDKRVRKISLASVLGIVILVGGFYFARESSFISDSPVLARFASISLTETTTQSRFLVWRMSWEGIKERSLLGWGPENYGQVFAKHYNPLMWKQEPWFDRAHNVIFDWLVNAGMIGLATYLLVLVAAIYCLYRLIRQNRLNPDLLEKSSPGSNLSISKAAPAVLIALLAAYFFQNIFVFDNVISYFLFFTALAHIHFLRTEDLFVPEKKNAPKVRARAIANPAAVYGGGAVIVLALVFGLYNLNIKPINVARNLIAALQPLPDSPTLIESAAAQKLEAFNKIFEAKTFGSSEASEHLLFHTLELLGRGDLSEGTKTSFGQLAVNQAPLYLAMNENNARAHLVVGTFMSNIGRYDEAYEHLTRAWELAPNKQAIMFELGSLLVEGFGGEKREKGLEILKQALELEPEFIEARKVYALALIISGNQTEAEEVLRPIEEKEEFIMDDRFIQVYYHVKKNWLADRQVEKRLNYLEKKVKSNPAECSIYLIFANNLIAAGQTEKAGIILKQAILSDPRVAKQATELLKAVE